MNFNEAKIAQLAQATTHRLHGHAIEFSVSQASSAVSTRSRWKPVRICLCTHDAPDNPCPCDRFSTIWWLWEESIVGQGRSGRKDHEGKELDYFDVDTGARILVESIRSVSVQSLVRKGSRAVTDLIRDGNGGDASNPPTSLAALPQFWVGFFGSLLASAAWDGIKSLFDEPTEEEKKRAKEWLEDNGWI